MMADCKKVISHMHLTNIKSTAPIKQNGKIFPLFTLKKVILNQISSQSSYSQRKDSRSQNSKRNNVIYFLDFEHQCVCPGEFESVKRFSRIMQATVFFQGQTSIWNVHCGKKLFITTRVYLSINVYIAATNILIVSRYTCSLAP